MPAHRLTRRRLAASEARMHLLFTPKNLPPLRLSREAAPRKIASRELQINMIVSVAIRIDSCLKCVTLM